MNRARSRHARATVVTLALALAITASAPLTAHAAPAPEKVDVRLSGVIGNCHPDWVHTYHRRGQPIDKWLVRIAGTDLVKLIGPGPGRMNISIEDSDGDDNNSIPFDRHTPPTAIAYINGPRAKIMVSVQADPPNGRGCSAIYNLDHS